MRIYWLAYLLTDDGRFGASGAIGDLGERCKLSLLHRLYESRLTARSLCTV